MPHVGHIHLVFRLLDMVPSSSADVVTTRVAWMFSWRLKMRVKRLGLTTCTKSTLQEWLFVDHTGVFETGSDLEITCEGLRYDKGLYRGSTLIPFMTEIK